MNFIICNKIHDIECVCVYKLVFIYMRLIIYIKGFKAQLLKCMKLQIRNVFLIKLSRFFLKKILKMCTSCKFSLK
jgi:hypothetical protein